MHFSRSSLIKLPSSIFFSAADTYPHRVRLDWTGLWDTSHRYCARGVQTFVAKRVKFGEMTMCEVRTFSLTIFKPSTLNYWIILWFICCIISLAFQWLSDVQEKKVDVKCFRFWTYLCTIEYEMSFFKKIFLFKEIFCILRSTEWRHDFSGLFQ